jgi:hypothetical protein
VIHVFDEFLAVSSLSRVVDPRRGQGRSACEAVSVCDCVVVVYFGSARLTALAVDAKVQDDPIDPCVEARVTLERRKIPVDLDERILRDVECSVRIANDAVGNRVDPALVLLDEGPEGFLVPLNGPLDESLILCFLILVRQLALQVVP